MSDWKEQAKKGAIFTEEQAEEVIGLFDEVQRLKKENKKIKEDMCDMDDDYRKRIKRLLAEKKEIENSDLSVVWDEFTNHLSTSHKTLLKLIDIHSNRIIELEKKFDEFKRGKK